MKLVQCFTALTRSTILARQLALIEQHIRLLLPPSRVKLAVLLKTEMQRAERCEFPHLYGTPPGERYSAWGQGTQTGYARAQSEFMEVRLRGIALWLTVAFFETRDSRHAGIKRLHRRIGRALREVKAPSPAELADGSGLEYSEAA